MDTVANVQQVLIIGAGKGGSAFLKLCMKQIRVRVLGIVDPNPDAPGLQMARDHGIPVYADGEEALRVCAPCIVFNMTDDAKVYDQALNQVGWHNVMGKQVAELFWTVISSLQAIHDKLQESQARIHAVIHNVREGIISIDSRGIIEDANPAIERVFGYTPAELIGRNVSLLVPESSRGFHDAYINDYLRTGKSSVVGHYREVTAVHKDGHTFHLELNVADMEFDGNKHFVGLTRDITERKILEEDMIRMALYDALTGLPNRTLFLKHLDFSLSQKRRAQGYAAVMFIDLDGFKAINDGLGHDAGDAVLKEVGKRLKGCLRESDMAARIGGDEFLVFLSQLDGSAGAAIVCDRLIDRLRQSILIKGEACRIGASIGIALFPDHGKDADSLIKHADEAMYSAKAKGKNQYCFAPAETAERLD